MSVELLHPSHKTPRPLREDEKELLVFLLSDKANFFFPEEFFSKALVFDMSDGGMGSIRFFKPDQRHFGAALVEADYEDEDGVPVSIAVNSDNVGELFEIDIWKVDFSPLKRYPSPQLVVRKQCI